MRMHFARHGETKLNAEKRRSGHTDVPLNDIGRKQALEIEIPPDITKIYSSDLIRCKETAEIMNRDRKLPIVYDPRLRERNFGSLEGKSWEDFDLDGSLKRKDRALEYDYQPYGGESAEQVKARVSEAIHDIKRDSRDEKVLVVTSAGVIRLLHHMYHGEIHDVVHNSSIHAFEFND